MLSMKNRGNDIKGKSITRGRKTKQFTECTHTRPLWHTSGHAIQTDHKTSIVSWMGALYIVQKQIFIRTCSFLFYKWNVLRVNILSVLLACCWRVFLYFSFFNLNKCVLFCVACFVLKIVLTCSYCCFIKNVFPVTYFNWWIHFVCLQNVWREIQGPK